MRVLAIDSSSLVASVAVVTDTILTAEFTMNNKKTHSQTLLPMIEKMLDIAEVEGDTIDAIAVSAGPGSFTGLRIGAATAKGLGLAWKKPLVSVSTLDAMAYNLWGNEALIVPVMDAKRNQVYTGIYSFLKKDDRNSIETLMSPCALDIEELLNDLNKRNQSVIFVGDGIPVYQSKIDELLFISHHYAPAHLNRQRAGAVGVLGIMYCLQGKAEPAEVFHPEYLRLSQAEREYAAKQQKEVNTSDSD